MGLPRHSIAFLVCARQLGVSFDRTLMLGRQGLVAGDERTLMAAFEDANEPLSRASARRIFTEEKSYAEPLFRHLGATRVDSLDASAYEGATLVHDLNEPLPDQLCGRYSAVIDGGTLEHVFDFPTALRSALEAVRVGGHYIAFTPTNNQCGHAFYQLSPELYYRALSAEHGYRVRCMLMRGYNAGARWYQVADPAVVRHRVMALSRWPVDLYVLAERTEEEEVLATVPQQSDYAATWTQPRKASPIRESRLWKSLSRAEPLALKTLRFTAATLALRRTWGDFRAVRLSDLGELVDT